MIAVHLTIPIACWRKGPAREFLETELVPPPATCYGALLSLVGEVERERHLGCRVTAGILHEDRPLSIVLRTLWQIKEGAEPQGTGANAGPDFQQLVVDSEVVIWCDSRNERPGEQRLEDRVRQAFREPGSISRFGGWSLGESTHLINDAWLLEDGTPPRPCRVFIQDPDGDMTLPVWVDHVGSAGTRYVVGRLERRERTPGAEELPRISP